MDTTRLPPDFKEFLKLLSAHEVEYLLIGGYEVGYHGYPRPSADLDIWIRVEAGNAQKLVETFNEFGLNVPEIHEQRFLEPDRIFRIGVPPVRLEIHTGIDGVEFEECYANRVSGRIDDIDVPLIALEDLKRNKTASGRSKDLNDLENL